MRSLALFQRGIACQLSFARAFATMTTPQPPASFTLDKSIFNETLYSKIRTFWFADLPPNFTGPNPATLKRWWGLDATNSEKQQVDTYCRDEFLPALKAIGPEQLLLPPFETHDAERESAPMIAGPLLAEVEAANRQSTQYGSETLLSLVLLFDQVTRNSFRTQESLPLVYNHYDRLAQALVLSSRGLDPNPVAFPDYMTRPAIQTWIHMPLLHSEDLRSHELWDSLQANIEAKVPADDTGGTTYLQTGRKQWENHVDAIRKFGRYPHRNACLGRQSTKEEKEWLKTGETFGVSQGKDEL